MSEDSEKKSSAEPMVASFGPAKDLGIPEASSSSTHKEVKKYSLEDAIAEYQSARIIRTAIELEGGNFAAEKLNHLVALSKWKEEHRCKVRTKVPFRTLMWTFVMGLVIGVSMVLYYSPTSVTHGLSPSYSPSPLNNLVPIFEKDYGPSETVYPMQKGPNKLHMILGKQCVPINVQSESDNRELVDLHHSLVHHIQADNLASLSSYRVGQPHCYVVLRTSNGQLVSMGNPSVVQVNWESAVAAHVPSSYCPERDSNHKVSRSLQVWVSYLDPTNNWQRMERRLDKKDAWAFQVEFAILHGLSVCDGTDRGVESLKQLVRTQ